MALIMAQTADFFGITIEDEEFGETFTFTYQDLVLSMLGALYDPAGYEIIVEMLAAAVQARAGTAKVGVLEFPGAPAVIRSEPMLAACPIQTVETGGRMYCMVS